MPRPRQHPKNKRNAGNGRKRTAQPAQSVDDLIMAAQRATENLQVEDAVELYRRALDQDRSNCNLMDALADLCLQLGESEEAFQLLSVSTTNSPQTNPIKWMYLAQLCKGEDAVRAYRTGIDFLGKQLEQLVGQDPQAKQVVDLKRELISAYCGIAELYMTDLCFEPNAEESCETAMMNALLLDNTSAEALQTLASLRISQCRKPEACDILQSLYQRFDTAIRSYQQRTIQDELQCTEEDIENINNLPTPEHCLALVKLLLECAPDRREFARCSEFLLQFVLQFDDENPEVWYLLGMSNKSLEVVDVEAAMEAFAQCRLLLEPLWKQQQSQLKANPMDGDKDEEEMQQSSIETLLCAVEQAEKEMLDQHPHSASSAVAGETASDPHNPAGVMAAVENIVGKGNVFQFSAAAFSNHPPSQDNNHMRHQHNQVVEEEEEDSWSTDEEDNAMDAT